MKVITCTLLHFQLSLCKILLCLFFFLVTLKYLIHRNISDLKLPLSIVFIPKPEEAAVQFVLEQIEKEEQANIS